MSDVTILVGTTKGVFLIDGTRDRLEWAVRGPFCGGWPINHVVGDPKSGIIWAAGGGDWHGAGVWRSEDGGENWVLSQLANGKMDEWLANDPATAAHLGMTASPPAPCCGGSRRASKSIHGVPRTSQAASGRHSGRFGVGHRPARPRHGAAGSTAAPWRFP